MDRNHLKGPAHTVLKVKWLKRRMPLVRTASIYHIFQAMRADGLYSPHTQWNDAKHTLGRVVERMRQENDCSAALIPASLGVGEKVEQ